MKNSFLLILIFLLPYAGFCSEPFPGGKDQYSIISWNIRMNNPDDGVNAWPERKDKAGAFLKRTNSQLICMQEVLAEQLEDLARSLPQYSWFGAGRDDGKQAGEYVPVFFSKKRYRLVKGNHFWLSETPDKPGKLGWDAACARMVTWVCLADRVSKDTLFVFNTHFDHIGVNARLMSAKLLTHAVDSLCGNQAVIITGDFNSTDKDTPHEVITEAGLKDSRAVSIKNPVGPVYTFTGFAVDGKPGERIDFIYVRNTKPVQNYIVREDSSGGFYLSDHLPVMVGF